MHSIDEGNSVFVRVGHESRPTRNVTGVVTHHNDDSVRIDVDSPVWMDTVTISETGFGDEHLTVYRGQTSVRLGSVDALAIVKTRSAQPADGNQQPQPSNP